jgi:hypothetical protein
MNNSVYRRGDGGTRAQARPGEKYAVPKQHTLCKMKGPTRLEDKIPTLQSAERRGPEIERN